MTVRLMKDDEGQYVALLDGYGASGIGDSIEAALRMLATDVVEMRDYLKDQPDDKLSPRILAWKRALLEA